MRVGKGGVGVWVGGEIVSWEMERQKGHGTVLVR